MSGLPAAGPPTRIARAGADLAANDVRFDHLRSALTVAEDGALVATPAALQDSSMLATLARAEALVLRAPHAPALAAGSAVEVVVLAELGV
jgi:molybdopterin molybdotransferase